MKTRSRKVRLKDVCDRITVGHVGPMKDDYVTEGVAFLRSQNIHPFRLNLADIKFVAPEFHAKLKKSALKPGDVAVVRTGYPGTACVIPKSLPVSNCSDLVIISPNETELDSGYLAAVFNSSWGMATVGGNLVGAAQQHFNVGAAKEMELNLPDLPTQRKIAGILSAYDDLIENNLRRIKILEEMTQSLYREWLVHFRFPGHEAAEFVDSPLGQIPRGWAVKTIADICQSVSYGFTASATRENIGPRFLRITDIVPDQIDWANVPFCEIPTDKTAKLLLQPGDIVIARTGATTGYAKRLNKLHPDTVFASYLVRARAKVEVSNRMLGILMESDEYKKFIQTNLSGSAQPQANAVVLTSMPLVVPGRAISEQFDQFVEPMIDEAELLSIKIQNLRRTRDLLLPKLLQP